MLPFQNLSQPLFVSSTDVLSTMTPAWAPVGVPDVDVILSRASTV